MYYFLSDLWAGFSVTDMREKHKSEPCSDVFGTDVSLAILLQKDEPYK